MEKDANKNKQDLPDFYDDSHDSEDYHGEFYQQWCDKDE